MLVEEDDLQSDEKDEKADEGLDVDSESNISSPRLSPAPSQNFPRDVDEAHNHQESGDNVSIGDIPIHIGSRSGKEADIQEEISDLDSVTSYSSSYVDVTTTTTYSPPSTSNSRQNSVTPEFSGQNLLDTPKVCNNKKKRVIENTSSINPKRLRFA